MVKIERFEDLICWQKARELVKEVYRLTNQKPLFQDFKLRDQLRGSAISSTSNIAEGFSRYHKKEFIRFLDISQSSSSEVKSLLYVVLDRNYVSPEVVDKIQKLADEARQITLGLLRYIDSTIHRKSNKVQEPILTYVKKSFLEWDLPEEFIRNDNI